MQQKWKKQGKNLEVVYLVRWCFTQRASSPKGIFWFCCSLWTFHFLIEAHPYRDCKNSTFSSRAPILARPGGVPRLGRAVGRGGGRRDPPLVAAAGQCPGQELNSDPTSPILSRNLILIRNRTVALSPSPREPNEKKACQPRQLWSQSPAPY